MLSNLQSVLTTTFDITTPISLYVSKTLVLEDRTMWQVLLAATIAGSGYFAKLLFHKSDKKSINNSPQNFDLSAEIDNADDKASIFRFSSASNEPKNVGKKLKGGTKGKTERILGYDKKISDDQRKSGKKFAVCLKKRRTGKNASAKCDSFDVKDYTTETSTESSIIDQRHTMWQVLLVSAVAGSLYFAKHLLHKHDNKCTEIPSKSSILETSSSYRLSSASHESNNPRKKLGRSYVINSNMVKNERKFGSNKKTDYDVVCNYRKSRKKDSVYLKKNRIGRIVTAKCDSFDVKDKSSFGYGVGVGVMYMMSAGKAKIDKLNTKVDETAKVVQELKSEICKRRSLCDLKVERIANEKRVGIKTGQSSVENDDINEAHGFPMSDKGGYASSILTEEPHRDIVEMDQLEAELESELLKLQVSTTETSSYFQSKTSVENLSKTQDLDLEINQCDSVMPSELDQKLCQLLIEQQESQIVDLECELQHTISKLVEKESELQALKDCVRRLTDFTLTCPTDEERQDQVDESHNKMINGNGRSMVGIKRAIDFD